MKNKFEYKAISNSTNLFKNAGLLTTFKDKFAGGRSFCVGQPLCKSTSPRIEQLNENNFSMRFLMGCEAGEVRIKMFLLQGLTGCRPFTDTGKVSKKDTEILANRFSNYRDGGYGSGAVVPSSTKINYER